MTICPKCRQPRFFICFWCMERDAAATRAEMFRRRTELNGYPSSQVALDQQIEARLSDEYEDIARLHLRT